MWWLARRACSKQVQPDDRPLKRATGGGVGLRCYAGVVDDDVDGAVAFGGVDDRRGLLGISDVQATNGGCGRPRRRRSARCVRR